MIEAPATPRLRSIPFIAAIVFGPADTCENLFTPLGCFPRNPVNCMENSPVAVSPSPSVGTIRNERATWSLWNLIPPWRRVLITFSIAFNCASILDFFTAMEYVVITFVSFECVGNGENTGSAEAGATAAIGAGASETRTFSVTGTLTGVLETSSGLPECFSTADENVSKTVSLLTLNGVLRESSIAKSSAFGVVCSMMLTSELLGSVSLEPRSDLERVRPLRARALRMIELWRLAVVSPKLLETFARSRVNAS